MSYQEKPDFLDHHHRPRKQDKRKKNRRFSEDQDKRAARINFKRYVQELEEELLDEEMDDY